MLADTARKEAQIKEINRIGAAVDALLQFALTGDESLLKAHMPKGAQATAPVQPAPQPETSAGWTAPVPEAPQPVSAAAAVIPIESDIPVSPCPVCNSTAPNHIQGGVTCISPEAAEKARDGWVGFVQVAPPTEWAEPSEDE